MQTSIENIADGTEFEYDICIVGSGPAGLVLTNELLNFGLRICVLERGSEFLSSQENKKQSESIGQIQIKENGREYVFGGTSNTWGGASSPYDQVDFENWPISYEEITKYYNKLENYDFPKLADFNLQKNKVLHPSSTVDFADGNLSEKIFIIKSSPLNFASKYKDIFTKKININIDLFLQSTVININLSPTEGASASVTSLDVVFKSKIEFKIKAKKIILACGGVETVRLLLLSKLNSKDSTLNNYKFLGKFITNHPKGNYGTVYLKENIGKAPRYLGKTFSEGLYFAGLRLKECFQKEQNLLNSYIRLEQLPSWKNNKGLESLVKLLNILKIRIKKIKNRNYKDFSYNDSSEIFLTYVDFSNLISNSREIFRFIFHKFILRKREMISAFYVRNFMEMEARFENEITLGEKRDINDLPIAKINLNLSQKDKKSLIILHNEFKKVLEGNNIGTYVGDLENENDWPVLTDASHYLGGTIMGKSTEDSVVDMNLKLHNINNLYICSSSVFPSSGNANPTYTICALAVRLSDHLKTFYTK